MRPRCDVARRLSPRDRRRLRFGSPQAGITPSGTLRWVVPRPPLAILLLLLAPACGAPATPATPVAPALPPPAAVSAAPDPPPAPSFVVRGHVLGHDGKPMKLAHVVIDGGEPSPVADDGAFRIVRTKPGFLSVRVAGVGHAEHVFGLLVDAGEQDVEIRLGTYERSDGAGARVVIHSGAAGKRLVPMKQGADGILTADVDADGTALVYQIAGLFRNRTANGPEADAFEYDGGGDYKSILHPQKGKLTIHVDPSSLPPGGARAELSFADPTSRAARIDRLHEDVEQRAEENDRRRPPADPSWRAPLAAAIGAEHDPDVLAALRMAYLVPPPPPGSDEAAGVARALLDALAPGAPLWAFWPEAAITAVDLAQRGAAGDAYLDAFPDALEDPGAAGAFWRTRLEAVANAGREDELVRLFPVFRQRFADTDVARAVAIFDPARRIRPRRPLPDFSLPSLPEPTRPTRSITPAALRGKVALIDLWGTWCGPCREEVKYLTRAFEAHARDGFTIVSIAAHDHVQSVQRFRAVWKMPWTHVVLDDKNQDKTLRLFENAGFPEPILVDREGTILAVGEAVRGEELEPAIARALAAKAKAGPDK